MKPNIINPFTSVKDDAAPLLVLVTRPAKKEHVLLPKPSSFKELIPLVHEAFNLEKSNKMTWYITSCGMCPGEKVRVVNSVFENKWFWQIVEHLVVEVAGDRVAVVSEEVPQASGSGSGGGATAGESPRISHRHKTRRTTQVISRKATRPRSSIAIDPQDVESNDPAPAPAPAQSAPTPTPTPPPPVGATRRERTHSTHPPSSSRRHSVSAHQPKPKSEPNTNTPAEGPGSSNQDAGGKQHSSNSRSQTLGGTNNHVEEEKESSQGVAASSQNNANTAPSNSSERFNFLVVHETTGKEQHFRGRGTYSVQKVLDKVCDVLDLDSSIARLFQYVDVEDFEEGEGGSKQAIPLERHQTLAECGIVEGSVLMISEDPPDYEEESEA